MNWNDAESSKKYLQSQYPDLPKIVIDKAYQLWDQTRKLSDKDRRKAQKIIDSLPDNPTLKDYGETQYVYKGAVVIDDAPKQEDDEEKNV